MLLLNLLNLLTKLIAAAFEILLLGVGHLTKLCC
jgi:hypothetical protein